MKFFLIMETPIAEGVTDKPTIMRVIEDDKTGKATMARARSIALAISGLNRNEDVQIAAVRETVRAA
jgi:hypothetical protein